jgi:mono/diheme cytochrome c family protein
MKIALRAALALLTIVVIAGWWLTQPSRVERSALANLSGDPTRGANVFWAGGCASCHTDDTEQADPARPVLSGGHRLETPFGTYIGPNLSPDPTHGIGSWTLAQFADAMLKGASPDGRHYYPVFPYTSYARMTLQDVADLKAFLDTLPASARADEPHQLSFPWSVRRGIGLWKRRYLDTNWVTEASTPVIERGRYLVEGLGHCGECHTPRDPYGGLDKSRWMAGAPNPSGTGKIPNITPAALKWSAADIAYYLETGFDPGFDSAGGSMAAVVRHMSRLPASDRDAIAAYVKALPAVQ